MSARPGPPSGAASVAALLADAATRLPGSGTPHLDAQILLAHALGMDRSRLLASRPDAVSAADRARFESLVGRRAAGVPVAYLTGRAWFYGLPLRVSPAVLVPRPETEMLVDWALARLASAGRPCRVLDVGTGSGAIALAIAANAEGARVHATDVSRRALAVARRNARDTLGPGAVRFHRADLLPARPRRFDIVVANLPYVAEEEDDGLAPAVAAHEPEVALFAGPAGLDVIRRLLRALPDRIAPDGGAALEIGWRQGARAAALARAAFPAARVAVARDLAGHDRVLTVDLAPCRT